MIRRRAFLQSSLCGGVSLLCLPSLPAPPRSAEDHVLPCRVSRSTPARLYDGRRCWCHPRAGIVPNVAQNGLPRVVMTMNSLDVAGSDVFKGVFGTGYIGYIITHHHHLVESWSKLDQAVKTGTPVRERVSHTSSEWRESFLMGMFNIAMSMAPLVADTIDLSGREHMLDLGGGPGTYAIHFCMKNQVLKATVYDLPTTRPFAEKTIEKFDLTNRIDFMDGNYVEEGIEGVYDVAWLSHILHGEGQKDCQRIIEKTVSALKPGGMIIVHDFILNNTMDGPLFPALFTLNMFLGTSDGQSYSEKQITDMLDNAGVKEIRRLSFKGPTDSGIITGTV